MKKYNYFDDDYEEYERPAKNSKGQSAPDFNKIKDSAADAVQTVLARAKEEAVRVYSSENRRYAVRDFVSFRLGIIALVIASVVIACIFFSVHLKNSFSKIEQFYADAGAVCTQIISDYGPCQTVEIDVSGSNCWRVSGLAYARQIDFDEDGSVELLVAYENSGVYYVEVWGYDSKDFVKLYTQKANTFADEEKNYGSFISIYHHSGKYYLGELSPDNGIDMGLFGLHGKKFKLDKNCEYDVANDYYTLDGKTNTAEFETIKLSYITSTKADRTVETVTNNISDFKTRSVQDIEKDKSPLELRNDAYYDIIEKYNEKFGKASYNSGSNLCYADGLCVVDLIDFNADGEDELLVIYRYDKVVAGKGDETETEPEYKLEVYSWNGTQARRAYETDGVSTMQDSSDDREFYILQHEDGKTNLCKNSYVHSTSSSRVWTATSRISAMDEESVFDTAFVAIVDCDWGYYSYQLDGKSISKSKFEDNGYKVPYFCNEDDYNKEEFDVVTLQGKSGFGGEIQSVVDETQKTIKQINPNYVVD